MIVEKQPSNKWYNVRFLCLFTAFASCIHYGTTHWILCLACGELLAVADHRSIGFIRADTLLLVLSCALLYGGRKNFRKNSFASHFRCVSPIEWLAQHEAMTIRKCSSKGSLHGQINSNSWDNGNEIDFRSTVLCTTRFTLSLPQWIGIRTRTRTRNKNGISQIN